METRSLKRKREQVDERTPFNFSLGCALLLNRDVLNSVLEYLNVRDICRLRVLSKGWNGFISRDDACIKLGEIRVYFQVLPDHYYIQNYIDGLYGTSFYTWGVHCSSVLFIQCPTVEHMTRDTFRGVFLSFLHHPVIQNNLLELVVATRGDSSPAFELLSSSDLVIPKKMLRLTFKLWWVLNTKSVKPFLEKFRDVEVKLGVMSEKDLKRTIRELECEIDGCTNVSVGRCDPLC
jgi:hypothetical protein